MNKEKKIFGAGGTGKSHNLASYLVEKEKEDKFFNFLITSYTHVGKNEIYKKYLSLKGDKASLDNLKYNKNYPSCKTFHSIVYSLLKETAKKKVTGQTHLNAFNKEIISSEVGEYAKELFFQKVDDKTLFDNNFKKLKAVLDLDDQRKKYLFNLYISLKDVNRNKEGVSLNYLMRRLSALNQNELALLVLMTEGNLYDFGAIFDPFKQETLMSKKSYIVLKYSSLFNIDLNFDLKATLSHVLSEDFNAPLHPIYNIRKLYELMKNYNYEKIDFYNTIIIDEAQDFPEVAHKFLKEFFNYDELILAGDPYQAIFLDLGYNSEFSKYDKKNTHIQKTLYRFPKSYLNRIRKFFHRNILVLDLLEEFKSVNETKFNLNKIIVPSRHSKDSFSYVGLRVIDEIKNRLDKLFLTHNLAKFKNSIIKDKVVFLPFKDTVLPEEENLIKKYLIGLLLQDSQEALEKYNSLINYYNLLGIVGNLMEEEPLNEIKEELNNYKISFFSNLSELADLLKQETEFQSYYKYIKDIGKKDFVISLSVHRSKGKTISEDVYYIPNMGMYYFLINKDPDFMFIHHMLKYVALTRPSKNLIYVKPIIF